MTYIIERDLTRIVGIRESCVAEQDICQHTCDIDHTRIVCIRNDHLSIISCTCQECLDILQTVIVDTTYNTCHIHSVEWTKAGTVRIVDIVRLESCCRTPVERTCICCTVWESVDCNGTILLVSQVVEVNHIGSTCICICNIYTTYQTTNIEARCSGCTESVELQWVINTSVVDSRLVGRAENIVVGLTYDTTDSEIVIVELLQYASLIGTLRKTVSQITCITCRDNLTLVSTIIYRCSSCLTYDTTNVCTVGNQSVVADLTIVGTLGD